MANAAWSRGSRVFEVAVALVFTATPPSIQPVSLPLFFSPLSFHPSLAAAANGEEKRRTSI